MTIFLVKIDRKVSIDEVGIMETRSIFDKARIVAAKNMTNSQVAFFLEALYRKNRLTYTHSINVGYMTAQICVIKRIDRKTSEQVVRGALLHDIGKIFTPVDILTKEDKLTEEEYEIVREHTINGVRLITNLTPNLATEIILDIVENHHERLDGSGYAGKTELSFFSQLIHAVDIYDAITSDRTYKSSLSAKYGLKILEEEGVDPSIIECLSNCIVR